ncbi:MAG: hypothetical protein GF416_09260 [Candidatus Altiarchaeales archaeon]|nr:hypothetical protein [Candidatus Altiarchaeales archaeon]MBD3417307.1 hypothetical protein [Candidatus Altiarchaeales archaeon]
MKSPFVVLGLLLVLAGSAFGEEYLESACQSNLQNDLANIIEVDDVDGDGVPNILVGTSINGVLYNYIYKGANCRVEWSALDSNGWSFNTRGDVKSVYSGDIDLDDRGEVAVNSVKSTHPKSQQPSEYVWVISGDNALVDWNFDKECGLTHSIYAADIDGTGVLNVIMGAHSGKICALKDDTKQKTPVLWSYDTKRHPIYFVKTGDLNGDGNLETVALSSKYGEAYVIAVSSTGTLLWEQKIDGGVYTPAIAGNIMDVTDLEGDGKAEIIVGTFENGAIVYNGDGSIRWSSEKGKLVSSILATDLDGGTDEVLVGSSPTVTALDSNGNVKWRWTAPLDNTINSMSAYDIDGDGKKEVAVGKTRYIRVLDDNGMLKGGWQYLVEIQGSDKKYEERDASAVAVYMGDLDSDGDAEVAAAWNWEEDTIVGNKYSADIRVYEINKDYAPTTSTVYTPPSTATQHTTVTTHPPTTLYQPPTTTLYEEDDDAGGGICCIPMLPAILAIAVAIAARLPLACGKY